jgi:hypothetical protein
VQTAEVEAVGEVVQAEAEMEEEEAVAAEEMAATLPMLVAVEMVEAAEETAEPAMRVPPRVAEAALPETLVEEPVVPEVEEEAAAEVVGRAERSARFCGPREIYRESSIPYQLEPV